MTMTKRVKQRQIKKNDPRPTLFQLKNGIGGFKEIVMGLKYCIHIIKVGAQVQCILMMS